MSTKVIFKCDDLTNLSNNILFFDKIISENDIKVAWGIIGNSLNRPSKQYVEWIQEKYNSGNYEFWNHGYSHSSYEFQKKSILNQYLHILKTQKLAQKKLGFQLCCFGAPENHINKKTAFALFFLPQIKGWFYGIKNGRQHIFTRSIEVEFPCGNVVFEKFKTAYNIHEKQCDVITYQLHPNGWKKKDFTEFKQVIDFLKTKRVKFMLPKDFYDKPKEKGFTMIKFLDIEKINNRFRGEMDARIKEILDAGWYLSGKWNDVFAEHFAKFCGTKHAVGVANGLDAINLIIRGYGFGPGDEIIVPANTYIATILAISENGCTPVLVEPDINTYDIDPEKIEEKITDKTRAIIVVHLYGQAVQMAKI